jgi:hypothetical protein
MGRRRVRRTMLRGVVLPAGEGEGSDGPGPADASGHDAGHAKSAHERPGDRCDKFPTWPSPILSMEGGRRASSAASRRRRLSRDRRSGRVLLLNIAPVEQMHVRSKSD